MGGDPGRRRNGTRRKKLFLLQEWLRRRLFSSSVDLNRSTFPIFPGELKAPPPPPLERTMRSRRGKESSSWRHALASRVHGIH